MQSNFHRVLHYEEDSIIKDCELIIGPFVKLESSGDCYCLCAGEPLFLRPMTIYGVDEIQAIQLSFLLIKATIATEKSHGCEFWWLERGDAGGFDGYHP